MAQLKLTQEQKDEIFEGAQNFINETVEYLFNEIDIGDREENDAAFELRELVIGQIQKIKA